MPIGIIAGLAGAGLSYFGQKAQADSAKKQAKYQWQQQVNQALQSHQVNMQAYEHSQKVAALQNEFQNEQILQKNKHTLQIYNAKLDQFAEQVKYNEEAANRAFEGIQVNRNRQMTQMAYERQDRAAALLQALGANDASIAPGNRSAQLAAAKATYGNYGRNAARLARTDYELMQNAQVQVEDLQRQHAYQNYMASVPTSVSPFLNSLVPMMPAPPPPQLNLPSAPQFGSGMSSALMIGNAAMAGYSAYNQFAKPTMQAPSGNNKMSGPKFGQQGASGFALGGNQSAAGAYSTSPLSGNLSNNFSGNKFADQLGLMNNNIKFSVFGG